MYISCTTETLFPKVSACLNFYFAPITCCLASFHAHTRTLLHLLYSSFWFMLTADG